MKKLIYSLMALLMVSGFACNLEEIEPGVGGGPVKTFETHFSLGANKTVYVQSVVEAPDGGYIISGYTSRTDVNIQQLFVVKTSVSGSTELVKTDFNFSGNLYGGKLIRTSDNKYVLVGSDSDPNVVLVKLDKDLSILWSKTYGVGGIEERGQDVVEMADGNYLVAASKGTNNADNPYFIKVKSDNGTELTNALVDVPGTGNFRPASITRNGNNFGVFGYNGAISIPALFFVKLDQNLNPLINKSLSELGNYEGAIVPNSTDGYAIGCGVVSQLLIQAYAMNLTGNGDESRIDLFTSAAKSSCQGMSRTSTGQYVPAGWAESSNGGGTINTAVAALLSTTYATQFTYQYGNNNKYSGFNASSPVSDGGFVFAGTYGDGAEEVLLVKLDKELKLN